MSSDLGPELRLLPVRPEDEGVARAAHADPRWGSFTFLLSHRPEDPWATYLGRLRDLRRGADLPPGHVAATFLLAWVGTELVGRTSVRHELDERLLRVGGHIGYGVLPDHRGRGYAAEMLRQGLVVARSEGVTAVLVTCDGDNVASARTIQRCGGVLDTVVQDPAGGPGKRRYWIR